MDNQEKKRSSVVDTVKLAAAVLLLMSGVGGFYYFGTASALYRVLALLAVAGVAVAIASSTELGRSTISFLSNSRAELRKVVWPTRAEAIHTTLIVLLVVFIVGIFLWLVDMLLGLIMRMLIGTGG